MSFASSLYNKLLVSDIGKGNIICTPYTHIHIYMFTINKFIVQERLSFEYQVLE